MTVIGKLRPVGELLRDWRQRRRMSQLDLACEVGISTKHLSFLETGRSHPSREMVLNLAERLGVPLRDQNILLGAAGYTPAFSERLPDDPALLVARRSIDMLLAAHDPNPALAIDRHWTMVSWNKGVMNLAAGADPLLLRPPVNLLRLSLHPAGLAPRIANLPAWRAHIIQRLRRQIETAGDTVLIDLLEEILDYPVGDASGRAPPDPDDVAVPFRLVTIDGILSFYATTMVFGAPIDVTLSELAIEAFFPTDAETTRIMREMADGTISRPMGPQSAAG
ncbi:MAG: helix-turn-helix transcriptional regulator [Acetobacteraceae bacterium]|nr:helix-turn-helix transcriptional regulator [Acetobacteraceae bacterium]